MRYLLIMSDEPRDIRNIALIGFMGSGKSSVGRLVAAQLGFQFLDTDELIERRAGKTISEIFAQDGETTFRQWEKTIVEELSQQRGVVISTGGGLGAQADNLARLKNHALVVCLWASPEVIYRRVCHQTHRPLLRHADPREVIQRLLAEREPVYKQADALLDSGMRSIREVAHQVVHQYHEAQKVSPV